MAQLVRALAALLEDPSSIPSTPMVVHDHHVQGDLTPCLLLASKDTSAAQTHTFRQNIHTQNKSKRQKSKACCRGVSRSDQEPALLKRPPRNQRSFIISFFCCFGTRSLSLAMAVLELKEIWPVGINGLSPHSWLPFYPLWVFCFVFEMSS